LREAPPLELLNGVRRPDLRGPHPRPGPVGRS
jgi:hypothetical protein